MRRLIQNMARGVESVIFPITCVACGVSMQDNQRMLCGECISGRFEDPNPTNDNYCGKIILPDGIAFQDALWRYDKQGIIQEIIRMLKYQGMSQVGTELGKIAGNRLLQRHLKKRLPDGAVLLPVPLHPLRKKKRGYNQARLIAEGMAVQTGLEVVPEAAVIRKRNTVTQTKFSFSRRMENLKGVFSVESQDELKGRFVIIVDDVFTTGSTCFSLGRVIGDSEVSGMGVMTIGIA